MQIFHAGGVNPEGIDPLPRNSECTVVERLPDQILYLFTKLSFLIDIEIARVFIENLTWLNIKFVAWNGVAH